MMIAFYGSIYGIGAIHVAKSKQPFNRITLTFILF
jgi:hypothetical protein